MTNKLQINGQKKKSIIQCNSSETFSQQEHTAYRSAAGLKTLLGVSDLWILFKSLVELKPFQTVKWAKLFLAQGKLTLPLTNHHFSGFYTVSKGTIVSNNLIFF